MLFDGGLCHDVLFLLREEFREVILNATSEQYDVLAGLFVSSLGLSIAECSDHYVISSVSEAVALKLGVPLNDVFAIAADKLPEIKSSMIAELELTRREEYSIG